MSEFYTENKFLRNILDIIMQKYQACFLFFPVTETEILNLVISTKMCKLN